MVRGNPNVAIDPFMEGFLEHQGLFFEPTGLRSVA